MTKVLSSVADVFVILDQLDRLLLVNICMSVGRHLLVCSWEVMFFLIGGFDVFERHINDVKVTANVK